MFTTPSSADALIASLGTRFARRFAPNGTVRYMSGEDWQRHNPQLTEDLGLTAEQRRRLPDVLISEQDTRRLILVDADSSRGPINAMRRDELSQMFWGSMATLIFVTAFPTRDALAEQWQEIATGTVAWIADEPDHLIHFGGMRILGPPGPTNTPERSPCLK